MSRRALLTGIGGQDGSYLAELLLGHGYDVYGTVLGSPERYETLDSVRNRITFLELDLTDGEAVVSAIRELRPDETYHLASVSFVPASWEDPVGTSAFAAGLDRRPPEVSAREHPEGRFLNDESGESSARRRRCRKRANAGAPITPYGAGKAFAHFLTGAFRRPRTARVRRRSSSTTSRPSPRAVPDPQGQPPSRRLTSARAGAAAR